MTSKQFFDWQTAGGTDDVMRLVDCLERADFPWCAIGGIAVNHWAAEPMVTQQGKLRAWADPQRRQSKKLKDLADIARLVENHPHLRPSLGADLQRLVEPTPPGSTP